MALVVEDLDEAMVTYSETLGLTWAEPWSGPIPVVVGGEEHVPVVAFTLSVEGSPHVELIQAIPNTIWEPGAGWHHVGVWAEEHDTAVRRMETAGLTIEVASPTPDFTYPRSPHGARIELIDARTRPDFARWLSGGRLCDPRLRSLSLTPCDIRSTNVSRATRCGPRHLGSVTCCSP